jgi:hypothetical protein
MAVIDELKNISQLYGIKKFHKVEQGDKFCECNGEDNYINHSYICGNDEIQLGIYDNEEYMIASFFHELGHSTDKTEWWVDADSTTTFKSESNDWKLGFELAEKHGYVFSEDTFNWCNDQLNTYKKIIYN